MYPMEIPRSPKVPMQSILTSEPMELTAVEFLSLEKGKGGFENVLVITDNFTKFAWAFPTQDQKASMVAKILWEKVFVNYGLPRHLHFDQGRDFEGKVIQGLCKFAGTQKSRTMPYYPQGNSQTEEFNKTPQSMFGTLDQENKH